METMVVDSHNTQLTDRVLWYDGDSTINEESLMRMVKCSKSTAGLFVDEITSNIEQYNTYVDKDKRIGIKEGIKPLTYDWVIPDEYKNIDILSYVVDKLAEHTRGLSDDDFYEQAVRVSAEMELYEKLDLMDVLRTLIFVINTLIENKVVWGVGRGSSVASYVLYLIGVHDVDSFKYGLNIEEFLRTE